MEAERGQKIAENFDMPFFEVSCKENINIEEAFLTLARRIREQRGRRVRFIRVEFGYYKVSFPLYSCLYSLTNFLSVFKDYNFYIINIKLYILHKVSWSENFSSG